MAANLRWQTGPWVTALGFMTAVALGSLVGVAQSESTALLTAVGCGLLIASLTRLRNFFVLLMTSFFLPAVSFLTDVVYVDTLRWIALGLASYVLWSRLLLDKSGQSRAGAPIQMLLLAATAFASASWSIDFTSTVQLASAFCAMGVFLWAVLRVPAWSEELRSACLIVAFLAAIAALLSFVLGFEATDGRYSGIFDNPNYLGAAHALLFPFALGAALRGHRWSFRACCAVVCSLLVLGTVVASSRGGLLAMAGAYLFMLYPRSGFRKDFRSLVALALPVVIAVTLAIARPDPHRFSSADSRSHLWRISLEVVPDRLIQGHGFGASNLLLAPYGSEAGAADEEGIEFHNSYITLAAELGMLGGVLYTALLWRAVRGLRRGNAVFGGVLVAGAISGIFESWMLSVGSGLALIYWFALLALATGERTNNLERPLSRI